MTYEQFISNILNTRGRFNCDGYKERHHIIPVSVGGTNSEDNLIDLYPEEHLRAHELLYIENKSDVHLLRAYLLMSRFYSVDSVEYENAKKAFSERISGKNNYFYGKCGSEHPRAKSVYCFETNEVYETQREAGSKLGIKTYGHISSCCNGKRYHANGYHFCFWEDYQNMTQQERDSYVLKIEQKQLLAKQNGARKASETRIKNHCQCKSVYAIELNQTFYSAREAERLTGISYKLISACCTGTKKSAHGLHWMFENDWDDMSLKEQEEYLQNILK